MTSTLPVLCLLALLAAPPADLAQGRKPALVKTGQGSEESLKKIDAELQRGEWAAAEAESRSVLSTALNGSSSGTFDAVARLAVAEAGQGRMEDALWHWAVASNLHVDFDPKPFGAPGELLASHPLRRWDEVPASLTVRRTGDGGGAFSPPRLVEAREVKLPAHRGMIPQGIQLQVLVDAQGRVEQPVVAQSSSEVLSYLVLQTLRDGHFEPARAGEAPVAAFYELKVPSKHRPLAEIVADFKSSPLAEPEATLRAGRFPEADQQAEKLLGTTLEGKAPSQPYLGVAFALKALAQAGEGQADGAICRWQAAQTLEPGLYGVDLSAYGAAGKLLAEHPWGEFLGAIKSVSLPVGSPDSVGSPQIVEMRRPRYPEAARSYKAAGAVLVDAVITTSGAPRNPLLLTQNLLPSLEASALDALCDWRFKPALYHGAPVPVRYSTTTEFKVGK
jgi:TonB family protein